MSYELRVLAEESKEQLSIKKRLSKKLFGQKSKHP